MYLILKELHVALELLDGVSCPVSLEAFSGERPVSRQPLLGLQVLREL